MPRQTKFVSRSKSRCATGGGGLSLKSRLVVHGRGATPGRPSNTSTLYFFLLTQLTIYLTPAPANHLRYTRRPEQASVTLRQRTASTDMAPAHSKLYPEFEDAFATMNRDWNGPYWLDHAVEQDQATHQDPPADASHDVTAAG